MEPERYGNHPSRRPPKRKKPGFFARVKREFFGSKSTAAKRIPRPKYKGFTGEFGVSTERLPSDTSPNVHSHTHMYMHTGEMKGRHKSSAGAKVRKAFGITGRVLLTLFLIGLITGTIVVGAFAYYVFRYVDGSVDFDLNNLVLDATTIIYATDENGNQYELQRLHGDENRVWVSYDEISSYMPNATIAIEDQRFRTHSGVDWKRTAGAFINMFIDIYSSR